MTIVKIKFRAVILILVISLRLCICEIFECDEKCEICDFKGMCLKCKE